MDFFEKFIVTERTDCFSRTIKIRDQGETIGKASRIIQNNGYVFVVDGGSYVRTIDQNDILNYIKKFTR